jgi:hypothetical protein
MPDHDTFWVVWNTTSGTRNSRIWSASRAKKSEQKKAWWLTRTELSPVGHRVTAGQPELGGQTEGYPEVRLVLVAWS